MLLKLRLAAFATVIMLITLTIIGVVAYDYVANAFDRQLDAALDDRAAEVKASIARSGPRFFSDPRPQIDESTRPQTVPVYVQVLDADGSLRYTSDPIARTAMPIDLTALAPALQGQAVIRDVQPDTDAAMRVRYSPLRNSDGSRQVVLQVGTPLAATEHALGLMRVLLVGTTLFSSAVVWLGVWFAASRTLAAVDQVTRTARSIGLSQRLDERIPEARASRDDEMGRLVRTFNNMLDRIAASFAAQRQFVADSSHELRSPLTVIRGNLALLHRTPDALERAAIARLIEDEAARMSRLVDNLLFLAQLEETEREGSPLDRRPVELDSLLLTVYQQARSMTERHTILLGEEDAITIDGDRDQLQQLLLNLVDNAIKYTPAGGTIVLGLRGERDCALLEVRDTGMGIPAANLPLIFDRFYRVDKTRSRRAGGAGLGLAIVQEIAASHGGRVEVDSTPGEGSLFRVVLPRTVPHVPPALTSAATPSTSSSVVAAGRGPH
ncbi:MAG TPA: ATP-binding protein [Chloroflexia bacterium]|nr:ATP-binding protein [Chloroflexia bacterium]